LAEQFDRPDKAQSCRRAMLPNVCVRIKPAITKITITASPMRAARRVGGGFGSGSGGCQGSGFLMLYLLRYKQFQSSWRTNQARGAICQPNVAQSVVLAPRFPYAQDTQLAGLRLQV
jgi:hypothetical protein